MISGEIIMITVLSPRVDTDASLIRIASKISLLALLHYFSSFGQLAVAFFLDFDHVFRIIVSIELLQLKRVWNGES